VCEEWTTWWGGPAVLERLITNTNNKHCIGKRGQLICRSCSFISFLVLIWLTNHDVIVKTQQNTDVKLLLIYVAFVVISVGQWRRLRSLLPACTFGCPLNRTCTGRRDESCWWLVFKAASSFSDRSLVVGLVASRVGDVGRWSVMVHSGWSWRWKYGNFEGSCADFSEGVDQSLT
jgi:hypothetical protein